MSELELRPMTMAEVELAFETGMSSQIVVALLSAALYGEHRSKVNEIVAKALRHPDPEVVDAAILSVAHCARLDGTCDIEKIGPMFSMLASMPQFKGRVEDALDDIEMFVGVKRSDFCRYGGEELQ